MSIYTACNRNKATNKTKNSKDKGKTKEPNSETKTI